MTEPIEIDGIDLTLKTDIADRDIPRGDVVPDAMLRKIREHFPEHFAGVDPATRFRWFPKADSPKVILIREG